MKSKDCYIIEKELNDSVKINDSDQKNDRTMNINMDIHYHIWRL